MVTAAAPRAALDIGSNTIRLLVARRANGTVETLEDASEFVRLGKGVHDTGRLQEDRIVAAIAAIERLKDRAAGYGSDALVAVATSAVRDAANGVDFVRRVRDATGIDVRILSGDEEAHLTYLGAVLGNPLEDGAVICDLGGGSAEIIFATSAELVWARSLQLGSGRLTEQFVRHDPPAEAEVEEVRRHVQSLLRDLPVARATGTILTGGTASHIGYLLGQSGGRIELSPEDLHQVLRLVQAKSAEELVRDYGVRPERAEVLAAGIAAAVAIVEFYRTPDVMITQQGIREGAIVESFSGAEPSH